MTTVKPISFAVNDRNITLDIDPSTPLVDVLREHLGLTGTKRGCDYEGECGACTVLLDGEPVRSCLTPIGKADGRRVVTVEGLGAPDRMHPLQSAFIEVGAVQCGYCTPGMLMASKALLDRNPDPSREEILDALEGNLCRCSGYTRIIQAVQLAAARLRGDSIDPPRLGNEPVVGGDTRRTDSIGKVTGQARYVEDRTMPGMLHARVLRSPHHHARLASLDTAAASSLPGVVRILTAKDIPGENGLGDYSGDEPILAPVGSTLTMLGAPIALVVGETTEQAQAGVEAILVEYEILPHVFDVDSALANDAVPIHEGGNILTTNRVAHGDLDHALAESDLVHETCYQTSFIEHAAMERESDLGYIDEAGRVTVVGTTHEPHWQQGYIAAALGVDPEQVRFIMPPSGGSFGGKQDPWPHIATGLMVFHVRRPVRLIYTREESFLASPKRHPYRVRYRIGATEDGRLTGIQVRIDVNTGGYDAHGQYIANYAVTASGGAYRWQAVDAHARTIYTNGPKCGQFRGFGTAQSTFALECTLDELAQQLGVDPLEFRLHNALRQDEVSFLGYPVAESLGYVQVLELIRPRYDAFCEEAERFNSGAVAAASPLRKGVGLSGMWYRFGKSGSLRVEANAELAADGHFVVYCSAADYGQGTNTVMSQFAAETLGVGRAQVEVINADTARTPDSGIQGASRSTYFVGGAVCAAARNLREGINAVASELLDCSPANLQFVDGDVVCQSDPSNRIALREVAAEFDRMERPRRVAGFFDLSPIFPEETRPEYVPCFVTGAQLVEVVVDLLTGAVQVTRVVAAHDVGRAINPVDASGQIEGAVVMGIGSALMEEVIPGASSGFGNYYLPTVKSMPETEVILVEVPGIHGPMGVKGLAEAAMLPTAPAIINAISRVVGSRIRSIPATPERVLAAVRLS
jgi:CO/xanthine dehydrogenase Mo-binding subunit/aerobic-type carbon monoxide dehydrogenase small subunit (CoxS/CutS family)